MRKPGDTATRSVGGSNVCESSGRANHPAVAPAKHPTTRTTERWCHQATVGGSNGTGHRQARNIAAPTHEFCTCR